MTTSDSDYLHPAYREPLQNVLKAPIQNFVTVNHLMLRPTFITGKNWVEKIVRDEGGMLSTIVKWEYVAIEEIYPAVHRLYDEVGKYELYDLGLSNLGWTILGFVDEMDELEKGIPSHDDLWTRDGYCWGNAVYHDPELTELVISRGIDLYNEYLEYSIKQNHLIYCNLAEYLTSSDDSDCAQYCKEYECPMISIWEDDIIIDGSTWLQITLPDPL